MGAADIVDIVGIAAVDDRIASLERRQEIGDGLSTTAAGTMSQTARGFSSFLTRSASEELPIAFSSTNSSTALGDMSKTTHSWPFCEEPADHVGAHPPESDHSKLHVRLLQMSE